MLRILPVRWLVSTCALGVILLPLALNSRIAHAQERMPVETLTKLKNAIALVKIEWKNDSRTEVTAGAALLVAADDTATHFAIHRSLLTPPDTLMKQVGAYRLVLGSGTSNERTVDAEFSCADHSLDIAILKVAALANPPLVPTLPEKAALKEGTPAFTLGFVLPPKLAIADENPTMTVQLGKVVALRLDQWKEIDGFEVEGLQAHGTVVVDGTGQLLGIVRDRGRKPQAVSALLIQQIAGLLRGRITRADIRRTKVDAESTEIIASANYLDPLDKVREISMNYVWESALAEKPQRDAQGRWPALAGSQKLPLKKGALRSASFTLTSHSEPLPLKRTSGDRLVCQFALRGTGGIEYLEPTYERFQSSRPEVPKPPTAELLGAQRAALKPALGKLKLSDITAAFRPEFHSTLSIPRPDIKVHKIDLPGLMGRMRCVGAGEYLLLEEVAEIISDKPQGPVLRLLLVKLSTLEVVHEFPVGEPYSLVEAGKTHLVIYQPGRHQLQSWSLETGKMLSEVRWPETSKPAVLALGGASEGPLFAYNEDAKSGVGQWIDLQDLGQVLGSLPLPSLGGGNAGSTFQNVGPKFALHVAERASLVSLLSERGGTKTSYLCLWDPQEKKARSEQVPFHYLGVPSADGKLFYSTEGTLDATGKKLVQNPFLGLLMPATMGSSAFASEMSGDRWFFYPAGSRIQAAALRGQFPRGPRGDELWLSHRHQLARLSGSALYLVDLDLRTALATAVDAAKPATPDMVRVEKKLEGAASGLQLVRPNADPVPLSCQDVVFPWSNRQVLLASDRYLVFQDFDHPRAMVFDLEKRAITTEINLEESEAVLAANASDLFAYVPDSKRLRSWNLTTGAMIHDVAWPDEEFVPKSLISGDEGPLWVVAAKHSRGSVSVFDTQRMSRAKAYPMSFSATDNARARVSSDGGVFVLGHVALRWKEGSIQVQDLRDFRFNNPRPSADGQEFLDRTGKFSDVARRLLRFPQDGETLSAVGSDALMRLDGPLQVIPHHLRFHRPNEDAPRAILTGLAIHVEDFDPVALRKLPLDDRLFWLPRKNLLVAAHHANHRGRGVAPGWQNPGQRNAFRLVDLPSPLILGDPALAAAQDAADCKFTALGESKIGASGKAAAGDVMIKTTTFRPPWTIQTAHRAGGDRWLIFGSRCGSDQIVFDPVRKEISSKILGGQRGTLHAAGKTRMVLYRPATNELQRWNLEKGELEAKSPWTLSWIPTELAMGADSEGPVVATGGKVGEPPIMALLDLDDLSVLPKAERRLQWVHRGKAHLMPPRLWVADDGQSIGFTGAGRPIVLTYIKGELKQSGVDPSTTQMIGAWLRTGADSRELYTARGVRDLNGRLIRKAPNEQQHQGTEMFLPAASARFEFIITPRAVVLYKAGETQPLTQLNDLLVDPEPAPWSVGPEYEERYHWLPRKDRFVAISHTGDRVHVAEVPSRELGVTLD